METTSRKRSDLDALYAIRDEIAAIEECDRKIQDRQERLLQEKEKINTHNIKRPISAHANWYKQDLKQKHKSKYLKICRVVCIVYLLFSILTGYLAWINLLDSIKQSDIEMELIDSFCEAMYISGATPSVALICVELLLAIFVVAFCLLCFIYNEDKDNIDLYGGN